MSRSPLAYPLNRAADTDVGGAADLQTDVMRFMAILALCLVAIFALVQSIPLTPSPAEAVPDPAPEPVVEAVVAPRADPLETVEPVAPPVAAQAPAAEQRAQDVVLTRPKWVPRYTPEPRVVAELPASPAPPPEPVAEADAAPPASKEPGFVLRFASDAALMRAVAAHHVGVYAIEPGRSRRMTVSNSSISFWDASTPNTFHEMETATVPGAVVAALSKTGAAPASVRWGVTLPGAMTAELDALMQEHDGGSLIIGASGHIHWEATP